MQITWRNRDFIDVKVEGDYIYLSARGCRHLMKEIVNFQKVAKKEVKNRVQQLGDTHWELLIQEALLKANEDWSYPYEEEEICHCRMIPTKVVDEAIIGGLHTSEAVGKYCSAGITCGNCKVDVENILKFRLKKF